MPATRGDAGEILTLQRACWLAEAVDAQSFEIPALQEDLATVVAELDRWQTYVVRSAGRLVASVRGRLDDGPGGERVWDIGRLMVAPDLQGRGLGRVLLEHIQAVAPIEATSFFLFTGAMAARNQRIYRKAGFRLRPDLEAPPLAVIMTKRRISG
ncbi:GNAT family N-acetyltransferase [Nocardioides sp. AN3]